jgi:hypothetical protein
VFRRGRVSVTNTGHRPRRTGRDTVRRLMRTAEFVVEVLPSSVMSPFCAAHAYALTVAP